MEKAPETIQQAIHVYLKQNPCAKLLGEDITDITPYKDKLKKLKVHKAYIENISIMVVLTCLGDSRTIHKDIMNASTIEFFLENSFWFKGKKLCDSGGEQSTKVAGRPGLSV